MSASPTAGTPAPSGPGWLRRRIIQGSLWLIGLRWILRGLGLIRTIVLARVLAPADFGLFTMTMLAVRVLDEPTSLDLDTALVRRPDVDRRLFDAAWTLRAIQRLVVALVLFGAAPLAGAYFNDARVADTVRVVALVGIVWAMENIGIVLFRKDLAFGKEIALSASATVVGLGATIAGALVWRNYWGLIAGFIAERLAWVAATYVFHPYRPRVSLDGARELWRFSRWIPIQNAADLLRSTFDSFLIGRFLGAAPTGIYSMAGSAASLPAAELVTPVTTTLLPSFARLADEPKRLARGYVDALGMVAILTIGSQAGIALIAPTFIPLVLGARWIDAIPATQWLAMAAGIAALTSFVSQPLMVRGQMRRLTALTYVQLAVEVPLLFWAAQSRDLTTLAAAKAGIALLLAPIAFAAVSVGSSITAATIVGVLWRPIAAAAVMAAVLITMSTWLPSVSLLVLLLQIAIGVAVFTGTLAGLWLATGRPNGAERFVLDLLAHLRSRASDAR